MLVELLGESTDVLKEEEGVGRGLACVGVEQEAAVEEEDGPAQGHEQEDDKWGCPATVFQDRSILDPSQK